MRKPIGFDFNVPDPFQVIVGQGTHSDSERGKPPVLPRTVKIALERVFDPPIYSELNVENPGILELDVDSVKNWMRAQEIAKGKRSLNS